MIKLLQAFCNQNEIMLYAGLPPILKRRMIYFYNERILVVTTAATDEDIAKCVYSLFGVTLKGGAAI